MSSPNDVDSIAVADSRATIHVSDTDLEFLEAEN